MPQIKSEKGKLLIGSEENSLFFQIQANETNGIINIVFQDGSAIQSFNFTDLTDYSGNSFASQSACVDYLERLKLSSSTNFSAGSGKFETDYQLILVNEAKAQTKILKELLFYLKGIAE